MVGSSSWTKKWMRSCCCARRRSHKSELGSSEFERSSVPLLYPMYVLRIATFLRMAEARPHQALRDAGVLTNNSSRSNRTVTFVSHQWCARHAADPHFDQLRVLQVVFRATLEGGLKVGMDMISAGGLGEKLIKSEQLRLLALGYIWYDYFSVPQPDAAMAEGGTHADLATDLGKAVASLAAYVDKCCFFVVLAPTVVHEEGHTIDYGTWKTRGWCRFERFARMMSSSVDTTLLLVRGEQAVFQIGAHDYMFDPVGSGDFSVSRDRHTIAVLAKDMLKVKVARLLHRGRFREYRHLLAMRNCLLEGLPVAWDDENSASKDVDILAGFMDEFKFASPTSCVNGTWPLTFATVLGNTQIMQALIDRTALVSCRDRRLDALHYRMLGTQPMHVASTWGHAAALELLVHNRADINTQDMNGSTLLLACAKDSPGVVRRALELRADMRANFFGLAPLHAAATHGRDAAVEILLAAGHSRLAYANGLNALHSAAFGNGDLKTSRLLIEAGVPLGEKIAPRFGTPLWRLFALWSLSHRLGLSHFLSKLGYHVFGMTPLMVALVFGNISQAKLMLEHGADPKARNSRGLTAYDLQREFALLREATTTRRQSQRLSMVFPIASG
mmetsp:Transcript_4270/g.12304  ORF Transcript_4270/g.12304 Transcript_4270/m.12304 type:complete len:615 (-) Transcript_4270:746-2590(-)